MICNDLPPLATTEKFTGAKVISWAKEAAEGITFSTTNEYALFDIYGDGTMYKFTAFNRADGLYIGYVAVPEASSFAVIFAILSFSFLYFRRKNRL